MLTRILSKRVVPLSHRLEFGNLFTRPQFRTFSITPPSFESAAMAELHAIAEAVDSQIDAVGAEAVEFHEGVLSVEFPNGTFVLNKHAASGQIWYSSPVSAPAYFDRRPTGWISSKLGLSLRDKFSNDILTLTGHRVGLE